uniref:Uncharacterized protein n=1 Tax=Anguilla anguilla TaxID=7936 RepID=A0A0E9TKI7_ANGAN
MTRSRQMDSQQMQTNSTSPAIPAKIIINNPGSKREYFMDPGGSLCVCNPIKISLTY